MDMEFGILTFEIQAKIGLGIRYHFKGNSIWNAMPYLIVIPKTLDLRWEKQLNSHPIESSQHNPG